MYIDKINIENIIKEKLNNHWIVKYFHYFNITIDDNHVVCKLHSAVYYKVKICDKDKEIEKEVVCSISEAYYVSHILLKLGYSPRFPNCGCANVNKFKF